MRLVPLLLLLTGCTTNFATDPDIEVDNEPDTGADIAVDEIEEAVEDTEDSVDTIEDIPVDTEPDADDPCEYYPTWFRDMDMDGWGRDDEVVCFPTQPEGYVDRGGDCCDQRHEVHPGVEEWADEPYTCPGESWDYDCDGVDEPRWPGLDPTRCEPYCGHDCFEVGVTEELCEGIWWDGGAAPACGEGYASYQCRWNASGGNCGASGGPFLPQQCR